MVEEGALPWARKVSQAFHDSAADVPSTSGGARLKCNSACFCSLELDCACSVHGNDFTAEVMDHSLDALDTLLSENFEFYHEKFALDQVPIRRAGLHGFQTINKLQ